MTAGLFVETKEGDLPPKLYVAVAGGGVELGEGHEVRVDPELAKDTMLCNHRLTGRWICRQAHYWSHRYNDAGRRARHRSWRFRTELLRLVDSDSLQDAGIVWLWVKEGLAVGYHQLQCTKQLGSPFDTEGELLHQTRAPRKSRSCSHQTVH